MKIEPVQARRQTLASSAYSTASLLKHASAQGPASCPTEMLHRRDQPRLDPADAAAWPGDRNAGLGPGQKPQGLAGIVIEDAGAAELHPADQAQGRTALRHQQGLDPRAVRDIADDREGTDGRRAWSSARSRRGRRCKAHRAAWRRCLRRRARRSWRTGPRRRRRDDR